MWLAVNEKVVGSNPAGAAYDRNWRLGTDRSFASRHFRIRIGEESQETTVTLIGLTDGLHFLQRCQSQPITVRDLKVGEKFIFFPYDGDDSGHGGFKGGARLFVKIEPRHPGEGWHESCVYIAREFERPTVEITGNLDAKVLRIVGV